MKEITVYRATMNSTGIKKCRLLLDDLDRICYEDDWGILPPWPFSRLREVWCFAHCFLTEEEAVKHYIEVEEERIRQARASLELVQH